LDQIEALISREGDTAPTQQKVGELLVAMVNNPEFTHEIGECTDVRGTPSWTLATHRSDGLVSVIKAWDNQPLDYRGPDQVHYHGGWEVLTMVDGNWIDNFYEPITDEPFTPGVKKLKHVGEQEIKPGEVMIIDPYTPHGIHTGERRDINGVMITYIGELRHGRRMDVDTNTKRAVVARPIHS
jgi:hypothetical protein